MARILALLAILCQMPAATALGFADDTTNPRVLFVVNDCPETIHIVVLTSQTEGRWRFSGRHTVFPGSPVRLMSNHVQLVIHRPQAPVYVNGFAEGNLHYWAGPHHRRQFEGNTIGFTPVEAENGVELTLRLTCPLP